MESGKSQTAPRVPQPPAISPDQILAYAPKVKARVVKIDANVAAYFGDMFYAMKKSIGSAAKAAATSALQKPDHKAPSNTGAAQNRS
jgi:hypothetical protein